MLSSVGMTVIALAASQNSRFSRKKQGLGPCRIGGCRRGGRGLLERGEKLGGRAERRERAVGEVKAEELAVGLTAGVIGGDLDVASAQVGGLDNGPCARGGHVDIGRAVPVR